ncbi:hypothetical protein [Sphingomonas paeninsulae]|uniref:hypothetical protein n=1 Tax=Sphingomonas paeninsulae TaxID=2319844 RepID=UPI001EEF9903|nr:hypothetical protein [Sphingomonas paeninsulae]
MLRLPPARVRRDRTSAVSGASPEMAATANAYRTGRTACDPVAMLHLSVELILAEAAFQRLTIGNLGEVESTETQRPKPVINPTQPGHAATRWSARYAPPPA